MRRLLRVPVSDSNPSSGCHGEPVASVSVITADGEACHIRWEILDSHLLSSGGVHCEEKSLAWGKYSQVKLTSKYILSLESGDTLF